MATGTTTPDHYTRSPSPDLNHQSPADQPHQQQQLFQTFGTNVSSGLASGLNSGVFLHFDKKLADCVKQFPCLYDSKTVGYKDKKTASKIWEIVAKEVEVENGEHAQKLYFNLKKRFHKRRNFLKRIQRSGTTNQLLLKKARNDVKVYSFLDWLIPYTQVRQPRVPIKPEEAGILEAKYGSVHDMDEIDDRPSFVDLNKNYNEVTNLNGSIVYVKQENMEDDLGENEDEILTVRSSSPSVNQNLLLHVAPNVERSREPTAFDNHRGSNDNMSSSTCDIEEPRSKRVRQNSSCSGVIMNGAISSCHNNRNNNTQTESNEESNRDLFRLFTQHDFVDNEDNLFGFMVGAELKRLPYRERCIAKLKIQNVLFDMQMSMLKKVPSSNDNDEKEECRSV